MVAFIIGFARLRPLQIYTALKRDTYHLDKIVGLRPLQIYTALKRLLTLYPRDYCLRPLQIYTALKLRRE